MAKKYEKIALAISFSLTLFCAGIINVGAADNEVETSVSMNVYKKIKEGSLQVETSLVEKRVAGVEKSSMSLPVKKPQKTVLTRVKIWPMPILNKS